MKSEKFLPQLKELLDEKNKNPHPVCTGWGFYTSCFLLN